MPPKRKEKIERSNADGEPKSKVCKVNEAVMEEINNSEEALEMAKNNTFIIRLKSGNLAMVYLGHRKIYLDKTIVTKNSFVCNWLVSGTKKCNARFSCDERAVGMATNVVPYIKDSLNNGHKDGCPGGTAIPLTPELIQALYNIENSIIPDDKMAALEQKNIKVKSPSTQKHLFKRRNAQFKRFDKEPVVDFDRVYVFPTLHASDLSTHESDESTAEESTSDENDC